MRTIHWLTGAFAAVLMLTFLAACSTEGGSGDVGDAGSGAEGTGTLQLFANGEDFVRQGMTSVDGWDITFDTVQVGLSDVMAHQTDPPYDPHEGGEIEAGTTVALEGEHAVDLAAGGADAAPILVGEVVDAPAGQYNAISFETVPVGTGGVLAEDVPLLLSGTATKEGTSVDFAIGLDQRFTYRCGEYVGDARKGFLEPDGTADLEMTFHFDHLFGDAGTPMDDDLNEGALGFDPLAALAEDGRIAATTADLEAGLSAGDFETLVGLLPNLGHVGEGHCWSEAR